MVAVFANSTPNAYSAAFLSQQAAIVACSQFPTNATCAAAGSSCKYDANQVLTWRCMCMRRPWARAQCHDVPLHPCAGQVHAAAIVCRQHLHRNDLPGL